MPQATRPIRFLTATLAGLISLAAGAQSARLPVVADPSPSEAAWRAGSRLGYGPTPASLDAMAGNPRAWALQQLDAAYAASGQVPAVAPEQARINAPMADLARDVLAERKARKVLRTQAVPDAAGQIPPPQPATCCSAATWRRAPPPGG